MAPWLEEGQKEGGREEGREVGGQEAPVGVGKRSGRSQRRQKSFLSSSTQLEMATLLMQALALIQNPATPELSPPKPMSTTFDLS